MRCVAAMVLVSVCEVSALAHGQQALVVRSATVIDGRGGPPLKNATIVVREGRIAAVGPDSALPVPLGARVIEGGGRWVIPGLIEVHTHSTSRAALQRALELGVTSALVIGVSDSVLYLEDWSAAATSPSPWLHVTPGGFTGEFPDNLFPGLNRLARPKSPEAARREVEVLHGRHATQLKIWQDDGALWWGSSPLLPTLAPPIVRAIVRSAHAASMRVYVHAWQMRFARDAVNAGVDALIHPVADSLADSAFLRTLAKRHMSWVTTLSALDYFHDPASYARRVLSDSRLRSLLAPDAVAALARDTIPRSDGEARFPALQRNYDAYRRVIVRNTLAAGRAGVSFAVGSDMPIGLGTHVEMELMVEAGLTSADVIAAASAGGARLIGIGAEVGTIEAGKRADLVVLRSDPLADIRNARDVEWTIKSGRPFQRGLRDNLKKDVPF